MGPHQLLLVLRTCRPVLPPGGAAQRLRAFVVAALLACTASTVQGQTPGELDLSFDAGSGVRGSVHVVVPAEEGKVYVGGTFKTVRGALRNRIARLNADGTADETFNPGTGADDDVQSITVQTDGKVLVGGSFRSYNGTERNGIARLNGDGSLDMSFNPGTGAGGHTSPHVDFIAVQSDGKVLIGGYFTTYNGTARNGIARINRDGSLDMSFNPGYGALQVKCVAIQSDGKVLIGGYFSDYNLTLRRNIARLNSDGSLDASFNPGTGTNGLDGSVSSVVVQADGKVLIGGGFTSYNGTGRNRIARLKSNGSLDTSFNPGSGASNDVYSVAIQADGKVLIGGKFTSYDGTGRSRIARLDSNGSLDTSFDPGTGADDLIFSIAVHADGKVLIGGFLSSYNGTGRSHIARLNIDGSLDTSFDPGTGADDNVLSIAVQADRKVLIGGWFLSYSGTARNGIARLNSDGGLDTSFNPGTGALEVDAIAAQADGKMLIGGHFTSYNGTGRNHIARLNIDGSLDTSFDPGTGADDFISSIAVQADGKLLIGGRFTSYNGTGRNRIARLNSDGSLDPSFDPGVGANSTVQSIALQADGEVLIGGNFTGYNGMARNGIARLNSTGGLDMSFNSGTGATKPGTYPHVRSIAVQSDGKILIGGTFTSYNGVARINIARLNSNGSLDSGFNPGTGPSNDVYSVAIQADGRVLISGWFTIYNGTPRSFLARVSNDAAIERLSVPSASQVQWLREGAAPEVEQVSFEYSADGAAWIGLGAGTRISGGWERIGLSLSGTGYIRARGRATGGLYNGSSSVIEQVYAFSGFSDADSDGLLDSWELTYWPATNGHNGTDDFDGDGVPELLELAFGLNPTIADAALQPLVVEEGGYLTITITKHAGAKYEVQTAGTLLAGQPDSFSAESTTVPINDASTLKVHDNFPIGVASARRFLRVKVSAAP